MPISHGAPPPNLYPFHASFLSELREKLIPFAKKEIDVLLKLKVKGICLHASLTGHVC